MDEQALQETSSASKGAHTFERRLTVLSTLALIMSSTSPTAGVFISMSGVIQQAGTGAFLAFVGGGIICVAIAYVYAELSSAFPFAGGEYPMIGRVFGPTAGFAILGLNLVLWLLSPAVGALGAASYLKGILPAIPLVPTALVIIGATTTIAALNIRTNTLVTGIFLGLELVVLIILIWLGMRQVERTPLDLLSHPLIHTAKGTTAATVGSIALGTTIALYAYNGFQLAAYFGEEIRNAPQRISTVILYALGLTVMLEAVPTIAVLLGAPDINVLISSQNPLIDFVARRGGHFLSVVVSAGVVLAIINSLIVIMLQAGRFLFATGREGIWPSGISRLLVRLSKRFGSPWIATIFAGVVAAASCLFFPLHLLLILIGSGLVVIVPIMCAAAIVGRLNGTTRHGVYRMPLFPVAPAAASLVLGYMAYANWLDTTTGRPSLIAIAVIIALFALYYLLVLRRRGWVPHIPQ